MRTVTGAHRGEFALAIPYLVHRSNGERPGQAPRIYAPQRPLGTVVAQGQKHALCTAFLARHYGDRPTGGWAGGAPLDRPIPTITTRDHHSLVAAFLVRYNGTGDAEPADRPLGTLTCRDRYGLVTVTIDGEEYVIVDIGMRMLSPRELYRAQGFPDDYRIDLAGPKGKPLTKTAQVRMVGNSVSPPVAAAIVRANCVAGESARRATEAA
jgi:DNA (cytosine-5)-methyltransferase 1